MARRKVGSVDWDAMHAQYRIGKKSKKQLAVEFGVTPSTVTRKAEQFGWVQDKVEEVDTITSSLLIQHASGNANPNATPSALEIKAAAQASADVVFGHRKGLKRLGNLKELMLNELSATTVEIDMLKEIVEVARNPDENGQDKRNDLLQKVISLPSRVDSLKKLAEIDAQVRKGEREAFGLDVTADTVKTSFEDFLTAIGKRNG
jgi:hypothetical protein